MIPIDGACLVEIRSLLDALGARVAGAEAAFAAAGFPELDGTGSMAAWLRHHAGLTDPESRRAGLRAERLSVWSGVARAWERGALTGAQVDLAVSLVPAHHVDRFARTDADTARTLRGLTPAQTRIVLRRWVQCADAAADAEAAARALESGALECEAAAPERSLFCSRTLDDVAILDGRLHPDGAAVVEAALRVAERPDEPDESRTQAARRADALIAICGFYLDNHVGTDELGRQRPHLTVVVDLPSLFSSTLRSAGVRTLADLDEFLHSHRVAPGDRLLFADALAGTTLGGTTFARSTVSAASHAGSLPGGTRLGATPIAGSSPAGTQIPGSHPPGARHSGGSPPAGPGSGEVGPGVVGPGVVDSGVVGPSRQLARAPSIHGARTLDGRPISALAVSVLTCDSVLERLLTADQRIIDHGRAVREFSPSQRRAVFARDQGCRFPGCALGPRHCQVHHLEPWQTGGRTDLANAVALCSFHHQVVHRPRWRARFGSRGEFIVRRADGSILCEPLHTDDPATQLPLVASLGSTAAGSAVESAGAGVAVGTGHDASTEEEDVDELVRLARWRARRLVIAA